MTKHLTPQFQGTPGRWLRLASMAALAALVGACMTPPPTPGQSRDEVLRTWGTPTARYDRAPGAQRLEYATGPYGRTTWMIDLDATGRVSSARQVMTEPFLMDFQGRLPGMPSRELLFNLGTPGERRGGGRQGGEIWSWRYETNDCLWFRVSIGDDQLVRDGGFYPDWTCDTPNGSD